jgi:hypothetical protein
VLNTITKTNLALSLVKELLQITSSVGRLLEMVRVYGHLALHCVKDLQKTVAVRYPDSTKTKQLLYVLFFLCFFGVQLFKIRHAIWSQFRMGASSPVPLPKIVIFELYPFKDIIS